MRYITRWWEDPTPGRVGAKAYTLMHLARRRVPGARGICPGRPGFLRQSQPGPERSVRGRFGAGTAAVRAGGCDACGSGPPGAGRGADRPRAGGEGAGGAVLGRGRGWAAALLRRSAEELSLRAAGGCGRAGCGRLALRLRRGGVRLSCRARAVLPAVGAGRDRPADDRPGRGRSRIQRGSRSRATDCSRRSPRPSGPARRWSRARPTATCTRWTRAAES